MQFEALDWKDVWQITPAIHRDCRGSFLEGFRADLLAAHTDLAVAFMQDNLVHSQRHVLRGMHYQVGAFAQTKLISVLAGEIWDVLIDLRPESASYGQSKSFCLSSDNRHQLLIPPGIAHGYRVLSDSALVAYKVDRPYAPEFERGIAFDDPEFEMDWGGDLTADLSKLVLSEKDRNWPRWSPESVDCK